MNETFREIVMKKLLTTSAILGSLLFAGTANAQSQYATVTRIDPNYTTVYQNIPRTECRDVEVPIYGNVQGGQASTGDTVLGAVIGGAIGNQVGGGSGKDAMTVLGAIVGADIANKRAQNQQVITGYRLQQQCTETIVREQKTEIKNYTIWYEWNGVQGRSYTYNQYSVGDQIPVTISINAR